MDDPPEQEEPEDCGQAKLDNRHQQPALKQLPQAGNKETTQSGKNVACGTLASHALDVMSGCQDRQAFLRGMSYYFRNTSTIFSVSISTASFSPKKKMM
jgi:hypothetical protein